MCQGRRGGGGGGGGLTKPHMFSTVQECSSAPKRIPFTAIDAPFALVLEAGGPRGHVPPQIFWRGGTGGNHAVRKCTVKFAVLSK